MVYTDDDEYGQHRGYDDFADFVSDSTTPSDAGLEEIRKRANVIVNIAYHNLESDSTTFTVLLGQWEMMVMDRMIQSNYNLDNLKEMGTIFLTQEERLYLSSLSGEPVIFSVKMFTDHQPYYQGGYF